MEILARDYKTAGGLNALEKQNKTESGGVCLSLTDKDLESSTSSSCVSLRSGLPEALLASHLHVPVVQFKGEADIKARMSQPVSVLLVSLQLVCPHVATSPFSSFGGCVPESFLLPLEVLSFSNWSLIV